MLSLTYDVWEIFLACVLRNDVAMALIRLLDMCDPAESVLLRLSPMAADPCSVPCRIDCLYSVGLLQSELLAQYGCLNLLPHLLLCWISSYWYCYGSWCLYFGYHLRLTVVVPLLPFVYLLLIIDAIVQESMSRGKCFFLCPYHLSVPFRALFLCLHVFDRYLYDRPC